MNTLLICPKFFGYEKNIHQALVNQGHCVTYIDEKPYNNNLFKIVVRLFGKSNFVRRIIRLHIKTSLDNVNGVIDYIIVVKGESLSIENVRFLKEKFPNAKFLFYAWDSIKNYPHVIEYLPYFDHCYTFDDKDIGTYTFLKHLPLFYAPEYEVIKKSTSQLAVPKVVFAGTVHSDRYELLGKMYQKYKSAYDFDFFLYFPSKLLLLQFFIKNYRNIAKYKIFDFSLRSKTKKEIASFFLDATAIIDIQHPKQNGLTMRTIEILPLERKLITTNNEIERYDFYSHNNVMIINRDDPVLREDFLKTPFAHIPDEIVHKYSVDGWVKKLLNGK